MVEWEYAEDTIRDLEEWQDKPVTAENMMVFAEVVNRAEKLIDNGYLKHAEKQHKMYLNIVAGSLGVCRTTHDKADTQARKYERHIRVLGGEPASILDFFQRRAR